MNMIKLLTIGNAISDLLNKYKSELSLNKYREQFSASMKYCEILQTKLSKVDIKADASNLVESSRFYSDLKVLTVIIIEYLPKHIFIELKTKFKEANSVATPEGKTLGKQYRHIINFLF